MNYFVNGEIIDIRKLVRYYPQKINDDIQWLFIGGVSLELSTLKYRNSSSLLWHKDIDTVFFNVSERELPGPYVLDEKYNLNKIQSNEELFNQLNIKFEKFLRQIPNFIEVKNCDVDEIRFSDYSIYFIKPEFYLASQVFLYTSLTDLEYKTALSLAKTFDINVDYLNSILERTNYSVWDSADKLTQLLKFGTVAQVRDLLKRISSTLETRFEVTFKRQGLVANIVSLDAGTLEAYLTEKKFDGKCIVTEIDFIWSFFDFMIENVFPNGTSGWNWKHKIRNAVTHYSFTIKQEADFLINLIHIMHMLRSRPCSIGNIEHFSNSALSAMSESGILHHYTKQHIVGMFSK